jgi:hypothetical protein
MFLMTGRDPNGHANEQSSTAPLIENDTNDPEKKVKV